MKACFEAAALATGCTVEIEDSLSYDDLINNSVLTWAYKAICEDLFQDQDWHIELDTPNPGSTDFVGRTIARLALH